MPQVIKSVPLPEDCNLFPCCECAEENLHLVYDSPVCNIIEDADIVCPSGGLPDTNTLFHDVSFTTSALNARLMCDDLDVTADATWSITIECLTPSMPDCPAAGNNIFVELTDGIGCVTPDAGIAYHVDAPTNPNTTFTVDKPGDVIYVSASPSPGGDARIYVKIQVTYAANVFEEIIPVLWHAQITPV